MNSQVICLFFVTNDFYRLFKIDVNFFNFISDFSNIFAKFWQINKMLRIFYVFVTRFHNKLKIWLGDWSNDFVFVAFNFFLKWQIQNREKDI